MDNVGGGLYFGLREVEEGGLPRSPGAEHTNNGALGGIKSKNVLGERLGDFRAAKNIVAWILYRIVVGHSWIPQGTMVKWDRT